MERAETTLIVWSSSMRASVTDPGRVKLGECWVPVQFRIFKNGSPLWKLAIGGEDPKIHARSSFSILPADEELASAFAQGMRGAH